MKLTEREMKILHFIADVVVATREQINRVVSMGNVANQNKVLKGLERCLKHTQYGNKYVYSLNKVGCKIVGIESYRTPAHLDHALLLTDFIIFKKCKVEIEKKITWRDNIYVPDGFYFVGPVPHLIEIDITQKMKVNMQKLDNFKEFAEHYYKLKKVKPILQFVSLVESRKQKIKEAAEERALHVETFTHSEILSYFACVDEVNKK